MSATKGGGGLENADNHWQGGEGGQANADKADKGGWEGGQANAENHWQGGISCMCQELLPITTTMDY